MRLESFTPPPCRTDPLLPFLRRPTAPALSHLARQWRLSQVAAVVYLCLVAGCLRLALLRCLGRRHLSSSPQPWWSPSLAKPGAGRAAAGKDLAVVESDGFEGHRPGGRRQAASKGGSLRMCGVDPTAGGGSGGASSCVKPVESGGAGKDGYCGVDPTSAQKDRDPKCDPKCGEDPTK